MTELRKWKFSDIWAWLKNAALATLKGELLLRLHVSRYFIHIIYTFFLFWVSIWLSLRIEKTLTRVEDNRKRPCRHGDLPRSEDRRACGSFKDEQGPGYAGGIRLEVDNAGETG